MENQPLLISINLTTTNLTNANTTNVSLVGVGIALAPFQNVLIVFQNVIPVFQNKLVVIGHMSASLIAPNLENKSHFVVVDPVVFYSLIREFVSSLSYSRRATKGRHCVLTIRL